MQREAVIVSTYVETYITPIITYTDDGRAVVRIHNVLLKVESAPGEWMRCGHYELKRHFWIFKKWVFIPLQQQPNSLNSPHHKLEGTVTLES